MVHQSNRPIIKNKKIKGGSNAQSLAVLLSCPSYNSTVSRWLAKNYESASDAQDRAEQLLSEAGAQRGAKEQEKKHEETVMKWKKCQAELNYLQSSEKKAKALECEQLAIQLHQIASAKRDLEIAHKKHKENRLRNQKKAEKKLDDAKKKPLGLLDRTLGRDQEEKIAHAHIKSDQAKAAAGAKLIEGQQAEIQRVEVKKKRRKQRQRKQRKQLQQKREEEWEKQDIEIKGF